MCLPALCQLLRMFDSVRAVGLSPWTSPVVCRTDLCLPPEISSIMRSAACSPLLLSSSTHTSLEQARRSCILGFLRYHYLIDRHTTAEGATTGLVISYHFATAKSGYIDGRHGMNLAYINAEANLRTVMHTLLRYTSTPTSILVAARNVVKAVERS